MSFQYVGLRSGKPDGQFMPTDKSHPWAKGLVFNWHGGKHHLVNRSRPKASAIGAFNNTVPAIENADIGQVTDFPSASVDHSITFDDEIYISAGVPFVLAFQFLSRITSGFAQFASFRTDGDPFQIVWAHNQTAYEDMSFGGRQATVGTFPPIKSGANTAEPNVVNTVVYAYNGAAATGSPANFSLCINGAIITGKTNASNHGTAADNNTVGKSITAYMDGLFHGIRIWRDNYLPIDARLALSTFDGFWNTPYGRLEREIIKYWFFPAGVVSGVTINPTVKSFTHTPLIPTVTAAVGSAVTVSPAVNPYTYTPNVPILASGVSVQVGKPGPIIESITTSVDDATDFDNNFIVDMPAIRPDGDLYVAFISKDDSDVMAGPAGWTQITQLAGGSGNRFGAWWHIGSSEPATYTWTGDIETWCGTILRISNADNAAPINAFASAAVSFDTDIISPSVTPTVDNSLIIRGAGSDIRDFSVIPNNILWDLVSGGSGPCGSAGGAYPGPQANHPSDTAVFSIPVSDSMVAITIAVAVDPAATVDPKQFTYSINEPSVLIGTTVNALVKALTYTPNVPTVSIGALINAVVKAFTYTPNAPVIPHEIIVEPGSVTYIYTTNTPTVGTSVLVNHITTAYTLTTFAPEVILLIELFLDGTVTYTYTVSTPQVLGIPVREGATLLDLTPPEGITPELTQYLHKNFSILHQLLGENIDGVFKDQAGKTIVIAKGIVVKIET